LLAGDAGIVAAAQVDALVGGGDGEGELAVAAVAAAGVGDDKIVSCAGVGVAGGSVPDLAGEWWAASLGALPTLRPSVSRDWAAGR
jgi:hypothetical protein